jgi:hypothetical protein
MASKNKQFHNKKDNVTVKWVKRAQMWCRTIIKDNNQKQEWYSRAAKPSAKVENQEEA